MAKLNLHCHTTYSYNAYGFSPSRIAEMARDEKWLVCGIVDFDVLDALDEFFAACRKFGVRGVVGMESRVFFPEMADFELNSPGEPGISYHMGIGFHSSQLPPEAAAFARQMKAQAAERTREVIARVNPVLSPLSVDYDQVAATMTPAGNVTERHVCAAYRLAAEAYFAEAAARQAFWTEKLGAPAPDDPAALEAAIRARLMKKGGVGYIAPTRESFPDIAAMNAFVVAAGGVPTMTWLSGESAGEADPDRLLDLEIAKGAAFINIIPDRNWNYADAAVREAKIAKLHAVIRAAQRRHMPIIIGTEMNAPKQKLSDDLDSAALAPFVGEFINGAWIAYAHTRLAPTGKGYLSDWAQQEFGSDIARKNAWFAAAGMNG